MEELSVKKDFSDIYIEKHPTSYLQEMKRLDYRIPDQTKPLYKHLAERIVNYKKNSVKILDIGSSYGINSALLNHHLIMSELDDYFVNDNPEPSIQSTKSFFDDLPNNDPNLKFYLIDTSKQALNFAEKAGLCEDSFCINLEQDSVPMKFNETMNNVDLIISTGCVGYIGWKSFENLFENIRGSRGPLPIFAFTVLRIFPMDNIERVFKENNFELIKTRIGPLKQRRFNNEKEMSNTIELLKNHGKQTEQLEDEGYYFADFFIGGPKNIKSTWMAWVQNIEDVFVPIQGN